MARWADRELTGWGRYPRSRALVARPETRRDVAAALADRQGAPVLAQGMRRSYGDAALLSDARVLDLARLNRMLSFDAESGWLRCEAGVTLADITATFLPRGFFPPVVPGTRYVSVGGALASDIHGKNHHVAGSWSNHVRRVELMLASGEIVTCDREREPELFTATAGGQGLTGIVLAMDVQLVPVESDTVEIESFGVGDLDAFVRISSESGDYPYSVGWIDGTARGPQLGRGVFMRARLTARQPNGHVRSDRNERLGPYRTKTVPLINGRYLSFGWLLNGLTMRVFNSALYLRRKGNKRRRIGFDPYFFPLDSIRNWNLMYGRRGFVQYQFVVPREHGVVPVRAVLEEIERSKLNSFLGVIKEFGDTLNGGLSFPMPGITVALDFANTGRKLLALLDRLDEIVSGAGGRVYLAKDARLGRDAFRRMYRGWEAWKATKDRYDPQGVFQSDLGRRLGICPGGQA